MPAFFVKTVRFGRIFRTSSHNVKLAENDGCFSYVFICPVVKTSVRITEFLTKSIL